MKLFAVALVPLGCVAAFSCRAVPTIRPRKAAGKVRGPTFSFLEVATTPTGEDSVDVTSAADKLIKLKRLIREEGGRFAFNTKYGALNPFAIYYGLVAIFLGIPWFFALTFCQLFYFVTRNKVDRQVRIRLCIIRTLRSAHQRMLLTNASHFCRGECLSSSPTSGEPF